MLRKAVPLHFVVWRCAAKAFPSCCSGKDVDLGPLWDGLAAAADAGFCWPCGHPGDSELNLQIYVYPLPDTFHAEILREVEPSAGREPGSCDFGLTKCTERAWHFGYSWKRQYAAESAILLKFLTTSLRVSDPADANLFVVPYLIRSELTIFGCHDGRCGPRKDDIFRHLTFYTEETKARHLFLAAGELSMIPIEVAAQPLVLTLGPSFPSRAVASASAKSGLEASELHGHIIVPSFTVDPDLVVAPSSSSFASNASSFSTAVSSSDDRSLDFFFAGGIANVWRDVVVDELKVYERVHPGSVVLHLNAKSDGLARNYPATPEIMDINMRRAVFCPVLPGDAPHTQRMFNVIVHGCIPVVIAFPTIFGGPGAVSWWSRDGPPWQWSVPGATILPEKDRIAWSEFVVQVPVDDVINRRFAETTLRIGGGDLERRARALQEARSKLLYDFQGGHPDAFSMILRQATYFLRATGQLTSRVPPKLRCESPPLSPDSPVCAEYPEKWQKRCMETQRPFGRLVCRTSVATGHASISKLALEGGTDPWAVAMVTWARFGAILGGNTSKNCRGVGAKVREALSWADSWAGTLSRSSLRRLDMDVTILLTHCSAEQVARLSTCPVRQRPLWRGRFQCMAPGVGGDAGARREIRLASRLWADLFTHVYHTASSLEMRDWFLLVPPSESGLTRAPSRAVDMHPPLRAWLTHARPSLQDSIENSICKVWWTLLGITCTTTVVGVSEEEKRNLIFAAIMLPWKSLLLPGVSRWEVLRQIDVHSLLTRPGDVVGAIWNIGFSAIWRAVQQGRKPKGAFNRLSYEIF
eukprot:TRINITY_DN17183_c0_g1_i1.p1 TRINITY_DN17183_c0_g1~~TRINITY_DN17183_c0_g1_i1.p1  ORF type:complete len:811 (-),score=76.33 TRINITY_DN17183_c0_g1_i1:1711-4143(-)